MTIVGRDAELELVRQFLTEIGSGPRALHLHGAAGIGKSTVWHAALAEARQRGFRTVSTRPTEAEARLPFAGLNDLFGELLDEVQPDLPEPQRRALEVALLRAPLDGPRPEPLAISLGILGLLRAATASQQLIVAVDDVPWLDDSSASVLEFVVRRLTDEPVGILVAERTSGSTSEHPPVLSMVASEHVHALEITPLSAQDIDRLLSETLGLELAPSTLRLLHRTSGGNAFYAFEIARAMQRHGTTDARDGLPVPDTLKDLVRDRLRAISDAASTVVAYAAALSQPTVEVVVAVAGDEVAIPGLAHASEANIVTVDDGVIRFTHPLLAAEAYERMTGDGKRQLHRRLADVVQEPEEHARHLALAAAGPDEAVAQELDRAAERANDRGAPDAAADMIERAVALSTDPAARLRRLSVAGQYQLMAGDLARARASLEAALLDAPEGPHRAAMLLRLGEVRQLMDDWHAAEDMFVEALQHAGDDVRLVIDIKLQLGGISHITGRNWPAGAAHVADAMRLADALEDPRVLATTIGHYATWQYLTGHGYPYELERRAAELEPWMGTVRTIEHPDFDFCFLKMQEGDWRRVREDLERLLARAERNGDYSSIPFLLSNLSHNDFLTGDQDLAFERLTRAERLARATGQRPALAAALASQASVNARLGRADEAWEKANASLKIMAQTGWVQGASWLRTDLALLELSRRDPAAAHAVLAPLTDPTLDDLARRAAWHAPTEATALVGLGRIEAARAVLDRLDRDPRVSRIPVLATDALRARALVLAADGDNEGASRLNAEAEAAYRTMGDRWELARTLLAKGELLRRGRHRGKAIAALTEAHALFDALGAELWAAQAREQLDRTGAGRADGQGLTPTQREVAALAMEGLKNRQIGERLFMSVHTVEAHLSSVYRTLRIASRGELRSALRDSAPGAGDTDADSRDSATAEPFET